MKGLSIRGMLAGLHQLPSPSQGLSVGDTYLVGSVMYAWDGKQWSCLGTLGGPEGSFRPKKEYDLTYAGVKVTVLSEYDISELFLDPDNLDRDDLAIFETTYPAEYKDFEMLWSDLRAKQVASGEINEWREKYVRHHEV